MTYLASLSYGLAALAYLALSLLLLFASRGRGAGTRLIVASVLTMVGSAIYALPRGEDLAPAAILGVEVVRQAAWLLAATGLVAAQGRVGGIVRAAHAYTGLAIVLAVLGLVVGGTWVTTAVLLSGLAFAVLTLVMLEQVYRNAEGEERAALRYLYFGLGGACAYDLFLYSQGLLLEGLTVEAWIARGVAFALAAPFIAIAAKRIPAWSLQVFVSRQAALFSTTVTAVGVYLLLMAFGGYLVRLFGGQWGALAEIVFLAAAAALLAALVASNRLRRQLRVFVLKHFYRHKYDYREEWLRFIATLSEARAAEAPQAASLQAVAQIIGSPAALLIRCSAGRPCVQAAEWPAGSSGVSLPVAEIGAHSALLGLLRDRDWVVDLHEHRKGVAPEGDLPLPGWLLRGRWRLVVPVMLRSELYGLLLLAQPAGGFRLTYEDRDLLKTAARHIATENARRHRGNPEFFDDAVETVRNTAERISRLIEQLQKGVTNPRRETVDLAAVVRRAAELCAARPPVPAVGELDSGLAVVGDRERLTDVVQHVIRNAQDATPPQGSVRVTLNRRDGLAVIEVSDTGQGMSAEFLRDGLFRPFHSTKGAKGMGVGAYQAREYARALGGDVEVRSEPGRGTDFRLILPLCVNAPEN